MAAALAAVDTTRDPARCTVASSLAPKGGVRLARPRDAQMERNAGTERLSLFVEAVAQRNSGVHRSQSRLEAILTDVLYGSLGAFDGVAGLS